MSKKKKPNPNRVPCTQADIDRAVKSARKEDAENMTVMWMTALRDKMGIGDDMIYAIHKAVNEVADSVVRGYATIPEYRWILRHEGGFVFVEGPEKKPKDR